ncbi:MAG TPA: TIGR02186 family protein [Alphaproteobacteria bacterium]|nr:TIGR02186 family protein [Alphaproteobacteria bacterium]
MKARLYLLAFALLALMPAPVRAQALVADLSDHLIAITAGFAGTDVLLFGATEGEGDVIVILRGPEAPVVVRRKTREVGIWVNTERIAFSGAPAFYRVAASRPLDEITNAALRARHQIGVDQLRVVPERELTPTKFNSFRQGLLRNKMREDLYSDEVGKVSFLGPRLFRTKIYLPANVPPGSYTVEVLLVRNNQVIAAQTTPMFVNKTGIGADVYDFAHRHAAVYGLVAVLIAVSAGWAAGTVFRRA